MTKAALGSSELEALHDLVKRLKGFYYKWSPLGAGDLAAYMFRIPRTDLPEEKWLQSEKIELVHICKPLSFIANVEQRDKEASVDDTGYVRDGKGELKDESAFQCTKCKGVMPLAIAKVAKMQVFLNRLKTLT